ncbi:hypothetical protein [Aeromicrobium sp. UC242_57]|uniref:hypothetical protein n=1 Tax=Aeromicrobium sp. UC242_57 TaxID=3374624 RepID=UPI0037B836DC
MRVLGDPAPNLDKQLTLRLDGARRLKIGTSQVVITIRDDGTWTQGVTELFSPMFGRTAGKNYPKVLS